MVLKPTRPIPRGCAAGFFAGRYKVEAEDFVVDELPAYEPSGTGSHLWLFVEKRGVSTFEMLERIGEALDFDPRAIGCAGLKDAQAISRQWISLADVEEAEVADLRDETFSVLRVSRHANKLRMGHLRGNRFAITLRGTAPADLDKASRNLEELARIGVPNYFGEQRFGKRGANLAKGLEILRGDPRTFARRIPKRLFGLLISAVQSEVFNRVLIRRLRELGTLIPGDLAFLHKNGACFRVADVGAEQARAERFEISPTGPLPGGKMMAPAAAAKELEDAVLADMDLDPRLFVGLPFGVATGDRRPLRIPLTEPKAEQVANGLQLQFTLPKGSYATAVLRELLTETIWFAER